MAKKTTKKPRRGRPPKPAGESQTAVLFLKMTPDERGAIDAAARAAGRPVSVWAREILLSVARK